MLLCFPDSPHRSPRPGGGWRRESGPPHTRRLTWTPYPSQTAAQIQRRVPGPPAFVLAPGYHGNGALTSAGAPRSRGVGSQPPRLLRFAPAASLVPGKCSGHAAGAGQKVGFIICAGGPLCQVSPDGTCGSQPASVRRRLAPALHPIHPGLLGRGGPASPGWSFLLLCYLFNGM